jgi:hypothetical protein
VDKCRPSRLCLFLAETNWVITRQIESTVRNQTCTMLASAWTTRLDRRFGQPSHVIWVLKGASGAGGDDFCSSGSIPNFTSLSPGSSG